MGATLLNYHPPETVTCHKQEQCVKKQHLPPPTSSLWRHFTAVVSLFYRAVLGCFLSNDAIKDSKPRKTSLLSYKHLQGLPFLNSPPSCSGNGMQEPGNPKTSKGSLLLLQLSWPQSPSRRLQGFQSQARYYIYSEACKVTLAVF